MAVARNRKALERLIATDLKTRDGFVSYEVYELTSVASYDHQWTMQPYRQ